MKSHLEVQWSGPKLCNLVRGLIPGLAWLDELQSWPLNSQLWFQLWFTFSSCTYVQNIWCNCMRTYVRNTYICVSLKYVHKYVLYRCRSCSRVHLLCSCQPTADWLAMLRICFLSHTDLSCCKLFRHLSVCGAHHTITKNLPKDSTRKAREGI